MQAFELEQLMKARKSAEKPYLEFLRVPSMSLGIYELSAGQEDPQSPHGEDEVYYVLQGRASLRVGEEKRPVQPGSIIYVPAEVPHKFQDIRENLSVLVSFSPAEEGA